MVLGSSYEEPQCHLFTEPKYRALQSHTLGTADQRYMWKEMFQGDGAQTRVIPAYFGMEGLCPPPFPKGGYMGGGGIGARFTRKCVQKWVIIDILPIFLAKYRKTLLVRRKNLAKRAENCMISGDYEL